MIEVNGKTLCPNCFYSTKKAVCPQCGYGAEAPVAYPMALAPGSVLEKRYIIGGLIGNGGFGLTYLAYDTVSDRTAVIKEYFPHGAAMRCEDKVSVDASLSCGRKAFDEGAAEFLNRSALISKLNGAPNIVDVYDSFRENNTAYMVMEYLRGQTLKTYIRQNGTIGAAEAVYTAKCVCAAVAAAHKETILHCDVSPDNIMIGQNGVVKLIDLGTAQHIFGESYRNSSLMIKFGFAPPERYGNRNHQGPWTDVYSVGTTLYYALTGDIPEDPMSRFDKDETFKSNLFEIDEGIWRIITKATALRTEKRYSCAEELLAELDRLAIAPKPISLSRKQLRVSQGVRRSRCGKKRLRDALFARNKRSSHI